MQEQSKPHSFNSAVVPTQTPPRPVKISHKKDGDQRQPHKFRVSWPSPFGHSETNMSIAGSFRVNLFIAGSYRGSLFIQSQLIHLESTYSFRVNLFMTSGKHSLCFMIISGNQSADFFNSDVTIGAFNLQGRHSNCRAGIQTVGYAFKLQGMHSKSIAYSFRMQTLIHPLL